MQGLPPIPAPEIVVIVQQVIIPILGVGAVTLLGWVGLRTWGRHLERRQAGVEPAQLEELREEVRRLGAHAAAADDLAARLGELEERLDFAERMLTAKRQERLRSGEPG